MPNKLKKLPKIELLKADNRFETNPILAINILNEKVNHQHNKINEIVEALNMGREEE